MKSWDIPNLYPMPMTDPAGAGRKMQKNDWGFVDGIHRTPYIAAPWIRHGYG